MKYTAPTGLFDIIPQNPSSPWKSSFIWQHVEEIIRKTAASYGFQEIRTPIFERYELFSRGVGESSDIVSKEMYQFLDKGERSMALRPEGTAPVMRALVENGMMNQSTQYKLYYIAPMFRYDRPQAGRYRQHHQFGVEAIGVSAPEQDAEIIDLLYTVYSRIGIGNLTVKLNSIGNSEERQKFRTALLEYLKPHLEALSEDSRKRFVLNPLRILDSKDETDRRIVAGGPSILDFLESESSDRFASIQNLLHSLGIPFVIDPLLVRGLDYYNHCVFEITTETLGAQNSIGGGGRYDGLLEEIGGQKNIPCCGFGSGMERMIQTAIGQSSKTLPLPSGPQLFIIPLGEKAKQYSFSLLKELRAENISACMDFTGRKLAKVMSYAHQIGSQFVAVIGEDEMEKGCVELKEMHTGEKELVPLSSLLRIMQIECLSMPYMQLFETLSKPFENQYESDFFINRIRKSIQDTQTIVQNYKEIFEKIGDKEEPENKN